jgi:hypothetical protein
VYKIILGIILLILAASFAAAADVRVPSASIRAVGIATSQDQANLIIVARDMGYGNEGLGKVQVVLESTGAVEYEENLDYIAIWADTLTVTQNNPGTHTYVLKVWDKAGNYAQDTVTIEYVNNQPDLQVVYPNGGEILARVIDIQYIAADIDGDDVKIDLYYTNNYGATWESIASNQENTGSYLWNTTNLPDGEYYIRADAKDTEGNKEYDLSDNFFNLSNTNPVITINSISPASIFTGTVTINFTTSKIAALTNVSVNGNNATLITNQTYDYIYTYDVTMSDTEGTTNVTINMTDLAGLTATTIGTFVIDRTGANMTAEIPSNGTYVADNRPLISLDMDEPRGINESTIRLILDGTVYDTGSVELDYAVSSQIVTLTLAANLTEGLHNVVVSADDMLGNSATYSWEFYVDTIKPVVVINTPAENETITGYTFTLSATITEANSLTEFYAVGGGQTYNLTQSGNDYTATIDTKYTGSVTVYATDIAGNQGTAVVNIIPAVDEINPVINNTSPVQGALLNDNWPTITADIYDASGINESSIVIVVDGTSYTTANLGVSWNSPTLTFMPLNPLSDGDSISVTVNASDTVGNNATKTWSFRIDSTSPIVSITSPAANSEQNSSVAVSYTITEPNLEQVQARLGTGNWTNITSNTTYTFTSLPLGLNTLTIRATDYAGNSGEDSVIVNVTQDISAPTIAFITPFDGERIRNNNFTVDANVTDNVALDTVELRVGSNVYNMTNVSADMYTANLSLADGNYNLILFSNDTAGNNQTEQIAVEVNTEGIYGIWTGTVTDQNGQPVFNSLVEAYLSGRLMNSTTTSADGSYTMIVEYGSYTVNVSKAGYTPASAAATVVAGQTTIRNIQLTKGDDLSVDSVSFAGTEVEGQTITITAALSKDNANSETVNVSLYVGGQLQGSKTVAITQSQTVQFTWTAVQGINDVLVSAEQLSGETNILNNDKAAQITIKGIEDVMALDLFAPPWNLSSSSTYYVAVIATNLGTETLANIPVNVSAVPGINVNAPATQTITSLDSGKSTTLTYSITTGTADNGTVPNVITATILGQVNATDTVQSGTGQGFN